MLRNESTTAATLILPNEIILEILVRLPVKTLLRFKSVCKAWNHLLSRPQFAKFHLKKSNENNNINHERLMFIHISLYSIDYEASNQVTKIDYPTNVCKCNCNCNCCLEVMGSCNGLLCISPAEDVIFLWNPSTRKSLKLPSSPIEFPSASCRCSSISYGLGYDPIADDYKLVKIVLFDSENFHTQVKVYSTKTDSWRQIQDFPYDFPYGRHGVFVNGALHWMVSLWSGTPHCHVVAALDLAEEKYRLVQLPLCEYEKSYFDIGVLGGCLFMFCCSNEISFDLWVMNEYGKNESWRKVRITMPCITGIEAYAFLKPLCLTTMGEIVLRIGAQKLILYNQKAETLRDLEINGMPGQFDTVTYVESLISPNADDYTEVQYQ